MREISPMDANAIMRNIQLVLQDQTRARARSVEVAQRPPPTIAANGAEEQQLQQQQQPIAMEVDDVPLVPIAAAAAVADVVVVELPPAEALRQSTVRMVVAADVHSVPMDGAAAAIEQMVVSSPMAVQQPQRPVRGRNTVDLDEVRGALGFLGGFGRRKCWPGVFSGRAFDGITQRVYSFEQSVSFKRLSM